MSEDTPEALRTDIDAWLPDLYAPFPVTRRSGRAVFLPKSSSTDSGAHRPAVPSAPLQARAHVPS